MVGHIVNDHFNNMHHQALTEALETLPAGRLLPKFSPKGQEMDPREFHHRVTEIFLRDRIAESMGLQQFDQFVSRILTSTFNQDHELDRNMLRRLLDYDPQRAITPITPVNPELNDVIHLGAKGFNLIRLNSHGLPVPPGFIVTTEVFRCREIIRHYAPAREQFRQLVETWVRYLEGLSGRRFGDPRQPLLLSVRSGSSISQPGMLSTFLDVGLNEEITEGMARRGQRPGMVRLGTAIGVISRPAAWPTAWSGTISTPLSAISSRPSAGRSSGISPAGR